MQLLLKKGRRRIFVFSIVRIPAVRPDEKKGRERMKKVENFDFTVFYCPHPGNPAALKKGKTKAYTPPLVLMFLMLMLGKKGRRSRCLFRFIFSDTL